MKSRVNLFLMLIGFGVCANFTVPSARAQTADHAVSYKQVLKACAEETKRFCPGLDASVPQPRSEAICLKSYKSSLSLACRRAVKATSP